jgi:hypothetical protein
MVPEAILPLIPISCPTSSASSARSSTSIVPFAGTFTHCAVLKIRLSSVMNLVYGLRAYSLPLVLVSNIIPFAV